MGLGMSWRAVRTWFAVAVGFLLLASAIGMLAPPRSDRIWTPYLNHVAEPTIHAQGFSVAPVSDWSFDASGPTERAYGEAEFRFQELRGVWFVLEPQPGSELAAHTLLLFEFEGDRLLGLTVEARREAHENYDAIRGAFNAYELSFVWATARDLLVGRVAHLDHEVYVYPLALPPAQAQALLRNTLARTQELSRRPRWYNTFVSNCTNELAKAAGLDWTFEWVLTGRSDEALFVRGVIPGERFADAKRKAALKPFIASIQELRGDAFDRALLARLRAEPAPR